MKFENRIKNTERCCYQLIGNVVEATAAPATVWGTRFLAYHWLLLNWEDGNCGWTQVRRPASLCYADSRWENWNRGYFGGCPCLLIESPKGGFFISSECHTVAISGQHYKLGLYGFWFWTKFIAQQNQLTERYVAAYCSGIALPWTLQTPKFHSYVQILILIQL